MRIIVEKSAKFLCTTALPSLTVIACFKAWAESPNTMDPLNLGCCRAEGIDDGSDIGCCDHAAAMNFVLRINFHLSHHRHVGSCWRNRPRCRVP